MAALKQSMAAAEEAASEGRRSLEQSLLAAVQGELARAEERQARAQEESDAAQRAQEEAELAASGAAARARRRFASFAVVSAAALRRGLRRQQAVAVRRWQGFAARHGRRTGGAVRCLVKMVGLRRRSAFLLWRAASARASAAQLELERRSQLDTLLAEQAAAVPPSGALSDGDVARAVAAAEAAAAQRASHLAAAHAAELSAIGALHLAHQTFMSFRVAVFRKSTPTHTPVSSTCVSDCQSRKEMTSVESHVLTSSRRRHRAGPRRKARQGPRGGPRNPRRRGGEGTGRSQRRGRRGVGTGRARRGP